MKRKQKIRTREILKLMLIIALLCFPVLLNAQDPNDPGGGGGDPGTPIDGGLGILLAAGVGYGVKKYRDHQKQQRIITDTLSSQDRGMPEEKADEK